MIGAQLCGETENAVGVVSEAAGSAVIVKIAKRIARAQIDVAVTDVDLVLRHKTAWRIRVFVFLGGLRTGKRCSFRNSRQGENATSRRRQARWSYGSVEVRCCRGSYGFGFRVGCTLVLLLCNERKRKERSDSCCCIPLTHIHPPNFLIRLPAQFRCDPCRGTARGGEPLR